MEKDENMKEMETEENENENNKNKPNMRPIIVSAYYLFYLHVLG